MIFVIYTPGRRRFVGGHVVLHKLIKILSDLNVEVWTNHKPLFDCKVNIIEKVEEKYDLSPLKGKRKVVLYPEGIEGNPLNIKNVARWILYHPKEEIQETWSPTDELFYFIPGFSKSNNFQESKKKTLTVIDSKLEYASNRGYGASRKGYCHFNKKKYPKGETLTQRLESTDLAGILKTEGFKGLVEEMNKHEYFITYDDATYYSIIAALCGCKSVILNPDPLISPEDYREKYPMRKYGVAYGWEDLKHADLTRDLLRKHIQKYESISIQEVESFVEFWRKRLWNHKKTK